MGDEKEELSDEEYDALLRELEGRAGDSGGGAGSSDDTSEDVEDIDAFLSSLETEEESGQKRKKEKTTTADADDALADEFAALEQKGELTTAPESKPAAKKKKKKKEKKKKKDGQRSDADQSKGRRRAMFALKTAFWFLPAVVLWWVLGVYMAQWVSAGWLIALASAMFVFGVPAILKKLVRRGNYRPWVFGYSLLLSIALIAPMPNLAGQNMAEYGHWPSAAIAEVMGADSDTAFVRSQAAVSGWLGGLVATTEDPQFEAKELGTGFPLGFEWSPEELVPLMEEGVDVEELIEEAGQEQGDEQGEQGLQ